MHINITTFYIAATPEILWGRSIKGRIGMIDYSMLLSSPNEVSLVI
jgi:hypothetical protein